MEAKQSAWKDEGFDVARSLLVLGQFSDIIETAQGICKIIPLKGISLLNGIYSGKMDREVGDIDILVYPSERGEEYVEKLMEKGYKRQFDYLSDVEALKAKRKIALLHRTSLETDIDIHLDLVTKRFFRHYCGDFNKDCVARCRRVSDVEMRLDKTDEWLFLAQHACFHRFEQLKWLRDLDLLAREFSDRDIENLLRKASKYGLRRIVRTCENELSLHGQPLRFSVADNRHPEDMNRFDHLTSVILHRRHTRMAEKIFKTLWEVVMVDGRVNRYKAFLRYVFPRHSDMKAIYRTRSGIKSELMRTLHIPAAIISIVFYFVYSLRIFPDTRKAP